MQMDTIYVFEIENESIGDQKQPQVNLPRNPNTSNKKAINLNK